MPNAKGRAVRLFATLTIILILLIFNAWFLNYNFERVAEQERWVGHTAEVISTLDNMLSSAKDLQIGARGFLIGNDPKYLQHLHEGQMHGKALLESLRAKMPDNSEELSNAKVIGEMFERLFAIDMEAVNQRQKAMKSSDIEKNFLGKEKTLMDSLRDQVRKMREYEHRMLLTRSESAQRARYLFFWSLVLTTVLGVAIITIAFRQFRVNQIRAEVDASEKAYRARIQEAAAELARGIAGDISLDQAATEVQQFLARKLRILGAKIFIVDVGGLRLLSTYGTDDKTNVIVTKRSLVHEAFEQSELWEVQDVPPEYWQISSSLGSARPKVLLFLPFSFQGRRLGVIEMALFSTLDRERRAILESISDIIAIGLNSAQSREHLNRLLEETQQQAEELQSQQEELRTNNEELEQQARALETQQQSLNLKNRELELTQVDLEKRAHDLERSSHYKSEFLAKMSHELRTPLNGLLILSTLLTENKEKNLTDQQLRFAKSINSAGNDLLMLINDILDLSKIEARKLALRPEEFKLSALFEQKNQVFSPQASSKGLSFDVKLGPNTENLVLHTDRQRLEQIMRNFLSNAIKFTEKGSVTIESAAVDGGKRVAITVRDTGIGIPQDKVELVFEAFEQADSSVSRRFGGTGLGLTISRELAHLLGGEITVQSVEGSGTAFTLTIPVELNNVASKERVALDVPAKPSPPAERVQVSGRASRQADAVLSKVAEGKRTILIVEDDESFLQGVVEATRGYGFEPITARDGEVALSILEKHTPDAILLDIKLPGISGLGILEMIKHMPHLRHIPVHMISALDYQHNALRMGALGYLTKPVTMEKVRSALERIENLISDHVRRILLIEDDVRQSEAISELVSGKDVEVSAVRTGKEAIDKLKAGAFDCIILDLSLPDVSGFDLLSELNSLEVSLPPIVIYTGKDLSRDEEGYLRKFSESIIIKGARSPERLLDEVNLFLHRIEAQLPESKRAMLTNLRSQARSFEDKTVLLVDDDLRNLFALTSALESKGLHVKVAKDGVEALEMLDKHGDIDLVMMDIMMPRMDGFEAMRQIRKSPNGRVRKLPVIALTAKAMREDHEKCMEAGASDYLPKPVNLDNLMTALKVWLAPQEIFA